MRLSLCVACCVLRVFVRACRIGAAGRTAIELLYPDGPPDEAELLRVKPPTEPQLEVELIVRLKRYECVGEAISRAGSLAAALGAVCMCDSVECAVAVTDDAGGADEGLPLNNTRDATGHINDTSCGAGAGAGPRADARLSNKTRGGAANGAPDGARRAGSHADSSGGAHGTAAAPTGRDVRNHGQTSKEIRTYRGRGKQARAVATARNVILQKRAAQKRLQPTINGKAVTSEEAQAHERRLSLGQAINHVTYEWRPMEDS